MSASLPVVSPNNVVATRRTTLDNVLASEMPSVPTAKKAVFYWLRRLAKRGDVRTARELREFHAGTGHLAKRKKSQAHEGLGLIENSAGWFNCLGAR